MTNIAICGANGKMGKNIYNCVLERDDCQVVAGIDIYTKEYADFPIVEKPADLPVKPDVIIDFSNSSAVDGLLKYAVNNHIPVVLCTTGLSDEQLAKVTEASAKVAVLRSANMSLGINLLMKLVQDAARALYGADFDIEIIVK